MCATTILGLGRRASSAASPRAKRRPRPTFVRAAKLRARQLSGSTPGTVRSASTTTSSARSASARTFGTVAARAGWPGSTCCVTKTIRTIVTRVPAIPSGNGARAGACGHGPPRAGRSVRAPLRAVRARPLLRFVHVLAAEARAGARAPPLRAAGRSAPARRRLRDGRPAPAARRPVLLRRLRPGRGDARARPDGEPDRRPEGRHGGGPPLCGRELRRRPLHRGRPLPGRPAPRPPRGRPRPPPRRAGARHLRAARDDVPLPARQRGHLAGPAAGADEGAAALPHRRGRGAPPARKRLRAGRGRGPLLRAVHLPEPPQPAGDERAAAPLGAGRRPARTGARAAEPGEPPGRRGVEGAGGEVTSPPATRYFVDVL